MCVFVSYFLHVYFSDLGDKKLIFWISDLHRGGIATATILGVSFVGNLGSSTWHGGVSDVGYAGICSGSWGGD